MDSPSLLTVTALGPIQDLLGAAHTLPWEYLRARELLLYLMCETHVPSDAREVGELKGFTLQELGAFLLPGASDKQVGQTLKALFAEARRHVGADRIVFHGERYVFNYLLPCFFDVREFERLLAEAKRWLPGETRAQAIPLLQQALALYRGEFMQGHSKRRVRRDDFDADESEWYLEKRYALQGAQWDALQHLGALLFEEQRYRAAAEIFQQLTALNDEDDDAQYRFIFSLAAQGLKSQALRHYKQLVERRGQTALDSNIAELVERIKRNEIVEEVKRAEGNRGNEGITLTANLPPPFQVPADLARFVGRVEQFEILKLVASPQSTVAGNPSSVIRDPSPVSSLQSPSSSLCLVGMGGIGKTSLAIHAAYRLRAEFPDGVLWGNLRESEPLAILASWERAYGCDFSGLPDLHARAASFRSLMHEKRVLVILDDVTDAADARPLLLNGAQTRTIFTTRSADIAAALDAFVIEMPVLRTDESADLLTRILGNARVAGQEMFAREICNLLGNLPLALDITAHRLVSRPTWTLREMVERLRAQMRRLDELQLADRAVRATFALSWDALNDTQKNVLAHVGVFDARSFTADALAYIIAGEDVIARNEAISLTRTEIASSHNSLLAMTSARDILDALVALSLVSFESHTRYRQHPLLADFSQERLRERGTGDGENQKSKIINHKSRAETRLSEYYLSFATTNRKNYLALEDEWDNLNVGIEIAHAQEMWQAVIDYGDVLTDAWFARGRFTDARKNYPYVMRGARTLEEQDPYINASLNWGKACIDQGDYAEAEEHLQHGLQTSREVNDEYNIANALFLLGRVSVERSEYDAAQKFLEESQTIRERIGDRAGVAETLYMQARICSRLYDDVATMQIGKMALAIYGTLPPSHASIVTLRFVAVMSSYLGNFAEAEEYMTQVFALCDRIDDESERSVALYSMSIILRQNGKLNEALGFALKSLDSLKKIGDRKVYCHSLNQISRIMAEMNDYKSALRYGAEGLKLYRELEDVLGELSISLHLGDLFQTTGHLDGACQLWSEALPLAEKIKHPLAKTLRERLEQNCGDFAKTH